MKKYNGLLTKIANEYGIKKGRFENEDAWKSRIVYSLLGQMAIAALYDVNEAVENISIIHMKHRIEIILKSYKKMYPELEKFYDEDNGSISNEIYDIYIAAGCIYHSPYRIVQANYCCAKAGDILFTRGTSLNDKVNISGLGTYVYYKNESDLLSLMDMFQIDDKILNTRWNDILRHAVWNKNTYANKFEYLRTLPPFSTGYWMNKPIKSGEISLARTVLEGEKMYFLYRYDGSDFLVSKLPEWQTRSGNYRNISNACIASSGKLPPIEYKYDGDIVSINFKYLPPEEELTLWKLFSWPLRYKNFPCDFHRICSREVFDALKQIMMKIGYEFEEE